MDEEQAQLANHREKLDFRMRTRPSNTRPRTHSAAWMVQPPTWGWIPHIPSWVVMQLPLPLPDSCECSLPVPCRQLCSLASFPVSEESPVLEAGGDIGAAPCLPLGAPVASPLLQVDDTQCRRLLTELFTHSCWPQVTRILRLLLLPGTKPLRTLLLASVVGQPVVPASCPVNSRPVLPGAKEDFGVSL